MKPTTAQTPEANMENDDSILAYINSSADLLSLLYDLDLMPEQLGKLEQGNENWDCVATIAIHWREFELRLRAAQKTEGLCAAEKIEQDIRHAEGVENSSG